MELRKKEIFAEMLHEERQRLLQRHRITEESWQSLHQKEVEFEETATKEQQAAELATLDEQDKQTIVAIDHALGRIDRDVYDVCEDCGGIIPLKRLEAVPWTTSCIKCSGDNAKTSETFDTETDPTELPSNLQGLSDGQLEIAVQDAVQREDMFPAEELRISCKNGKLHLTGLLPDKKHHSRLMQIVNDVLGFRDVEDLIKIDRMAWQRRDRTPGLEPDTNNDDEYMEEGGAATIDAIKEGKIMAPADQIIPEKSRKTKARDQ